MSFSLYWTFPHLASVWLLLSKVSNGIALVVETWDNLSRLFRDSPIVVSPIASCLVSHGASFLLYLAHKYFFNKITLFLLCLVLGCWAFGLEFLHMNWLEAQCLCIFDITLWTIWLCDNVFWSGNKLRDMFDWLGMFYCPWKVWSLGEHAWVTFSYMMKK